MPVENPQSLEKCFLRGAARGHRVRLIPLCTSKEGDPQGDQ